MRPVIAVFLTCLALAACGSTHKTVVVNPPPDSTTVTSMGVPSSVTIMSTVTAPCSLRPRASSG